LRLILVLATLISIFLGFDLSAGVMELGGSFSYDKQVFGSNRDNKVTSRTYGGSFAWYMFPVTGLELNYAHRTDIVLENDDELIPDTTATITQVRSEAITQVYGVGIRQAFASVRSLLVPTLSIGYAKEFKEQATVYIIDNAGTLYTVGSNVSKSRSDSVFGTFALKINFTRLFSMNGSVGTVFKAFEWNEAKYNVKYKAGFSWYF
jgi:hypothetical protein